MKILAAVMCSLTAFAYAGDPGGSIKPSCDSGDAWRLPYPPPPGWPTVEAPIKVNGKPGDMVLICNCTDPVAGKVTGVWVRTYSTDEALQARTTLSGAKPPKTAKASDDVVPYYLPGQSCMRSGAATIILGPADKVETWGISKAN